MTDEWRWFLDTDVQVAGFCITTLIVAFRVLARSIKEGDDALHSRINQVRDEYVRRIEFDMHFNSLRDDMRDTRDELKEANKRLDGIMTVLMREAK